MFQLSGKNVLVVGGRGLLGRRFCSALADFEATVFSADLPQLSLAASSDTNVVVDERITQFDVDVTQRESIKEVVVQIQPRIDVLIYSVTAKPKDFYKPFTECSLEGWQLVLRAELDGLFMTAQEVGKRMEQQESGAMIFLSSIYGIVGNDQRIYQGANLPELYAGLEANPAKQIFSHSVYPAAKGAVISLTRYLAAYWGEKNIRVNCISPGGLAHPGENAEFVARYASKVPLGRKAGLDEISGAIVLLASDAGSYITGHNLVVDGGWTAW